MYEKSLLTNRLVVLLETLFVRTPALNCAKRTRLAPIGCRTLNPKGDRPGASVASREGARGQADARGAGKAPTEGTAADPRRRGAAGGAQAPRPPTSGDRRPRKKRAQARHPARECGYQTDQRANGAEQGEGGPPRRGKGGEGRARGLPIKTASNLR